MSILVANDTLAFGAPIGAKDVREIAWPAQSSPEGAFANFAELTKNGRRITLSPFVRDEPIIASKVSAPDQRASLSTVIEKGKRAVTVAVDDVRGVAGFIFPGDFVDVVLTRTDNSNGPQNFSEVILQHVKVLAIDQMAGQRQEHPTVAKAVTVEVDPEQALRILLAANVGKLSLILRQPEEVALAPDAKVTDRDLFGSDEAQAPARPIQVCPPCRRNPSLFSPTPRQRLARLLRLRPKRPRGRSPSSVRSRANNTTCPKSSNDGTAGMSTKRNPSVREWGSEKARAASTRRQLWIAMLATAGAAAAGFGLVQATTPARAALKGSPCHPVREQVSALKVTLNKSRTLCFPDPFSTAVIGAPEIADLLPMTDSMLYVQGKKIGATNISVFDQQRRLVSVIDLDVTPDTTSLQNKIAASTGGRDINVRAPTARLF